MQIHRYGRVCAFADSDAAGVIHFSRLACYVEEAEHDFLRTRGVDVWAEGAPAWPRASFQAAYHRPLRPLETATVELTLSRIGRSSLTWTWRIFNPQAALCAEGECRTVHARRLADGEFIAEAIPDDLRERLGKSG